MKRLQLLVGLGLAGMFAGLVASLLVGSERNDRDQNAVIELGQSQGEYRDVPVGLERLDAADDEGATEVEVTHATGESQRVAVAKSADPSKRVLRGRISDGATGRPVAGARVQLRRNASVTNANGEFSVIWSRADVREERFTVQARGYVLLRCDVRWTDEPISVALPSASEMRGRVTRGGVAAAGVSIFYRAGDDEIFQSSQAHGSPCECSGKIGTRVLTDSAGEYRLTSVLADRSGGNLRIRERGGAVVYQPVHRTAAPGGTLTVDYDFPSVAVLEGRVWVNREPVKYGRLRWRVGETDGVVRTDNSGHYRAPNVPLGEATVTVAFTKNSLVLRPDELEQVVTVTEHGARLDFMLIGDEPSWISGRVIAADGTSVADAVVWATSDTSEPNRIAKTDEVGTFRVASPRDSSWSLLALHEGYSAHLESVGAGSTGVELPLRPFTDLFVTVRSQSGVPIKGCTVQIVNEWPRGRAARRTFVFDPEDGVHSLQVIEDPVELVVHAGHQWVPWSSGPIARDTGSLDVVLERAARVRVELAAGETTPPGGPFWLARADEEVERLEEEFPMEAKLEASAVKEGRRVVPFDGTHCEGILNGSYTIKGGGGRVLFDPERFELTADNGGLVERVVVSWRFAPGPGTER